MWALPGALGLQSGKPPPMSFNLTTPYRWPPATPAVVLSTPVTNVPGGGATATVSGGINAAVSADGVTWYAAGAPSNPTIPRGGTVYVKSDTPSSFYTGADNTLTVTLQHGSQIAVDTVAINSCLAPSFIGFNGATLNSANAGTAYTFGPINVQLDGALAPGYSFPAYAQNDLGVSLISFSGTTLSVTPNAPSSARACVICMGKQSPMVNINGITGTIGSGSPGGFPDTGTFGPHTGGTLPQTRSISLNIPTGISGTLSLVGPASVGASLSTTSVNSTTGSVSLTVNNYGLVTVLFNGSGSNNVAIASYLVAPGAG